MVFLFFAAVASVAEPQEASHSNPLALADRGFLQCYHPDERRKTCRSIASYERRPDGTYENKAIVLISTDGPTTLETSSVVVVKHGAVCGSLKAADIRAGTLRSGNRVIAADDAAPLLASIVQAISPIANKEICTRYQPTEESLRATVTIAGAYRPEFSETVKWIRPTDGYSAAP